MHVALVIERLEPWRGGAETSTLQFARHLSQLDCRVTLLTSSDAQSMPGITVVPIPASRTLRSSRTVQFSRRAAQYVAEHPFDVVHAITPCIAADVYQPRGGTLPETLERNLAIRSAGPARGFKRLAQKFNLKYRTVAGLEEALLKRTPPPWVIAISNYVAEQLVRHYAFPPDRIRLIFNGVDPDQAGPHERHENRRQVRRQLHIGDGDMVVLCVAHNFKLKGVARLIEAMGLLQSTAPNGAVAEGAGRVFAVVVGRDDLTPYMRLSARLGVADRVLFAGPTRRIGAFFHAADILAHPTYYDPCSRVVLEAMSAGLPAVTTRFNGASEKMTDGVDGFVLADPSDVEGLASAITRLRDSALRQQMSAAAREAVRGLTMAEHAAQVRRLYEDVRAARA